MKHWARPSALCVSIVAAGCADSARAPAGEVPSDAMSSTMQMEPLTASDDAKLRLMVDGRGEPMNAQAKIDVVEGEREVALTITGVDGADNLVVIDLGFDGVENVVGEHAVELGSPEFQGPYAVAMFEGQVYESSGGEVALSVSRDGSISGTFDIPLVQASSGSTGFALEPVTAMTGVFSGSWTLGCLSPIRGFTGGHSVTDSPYCNSLEL